MVWKVKTSHADNHYLDTEVYAYAAADIRGVRHMHLQDEEPQVEEKTQQPQEENNWIKSGDNWMGN